MGRVVLGRPRPPRPRPGRQRTGWSWGAPRRGRRLTGSAGADPLCGAGPGPAGRPRRARPDSGGRLGPIHGAGGSGPALTTSSRDGLGWGRFMARAGPGPSCDEVVDGPGRLGPILSAGGTRPWRAGSRWAGGRGADSAGADPLRGRDPALAGRLALGTLSTAVPLTRGPGLFRAGSRGKSPLAGAICTPAHRLRRGGRRKPHRRERPWCAWGVPGALVAGLCTLPPSAVVSTTTSKFDQVVRDGSRPVRRAARPGGASASTEPRGWGAHCRNGAPRPPGRSRFGRRASKRSSLRRSPGRPAEPGGLGGAPWLAAARQGRDSARRSPGGVPTRRGS